MFSFIYAVEEKQTFASLLVCVAVNIFMENLIFCIKLSLIFQKKTNKQKQMNKLNPQHCQQSLPLTLLLRKDKSNLFEK